MPIVPRMELNQGRVNANGLEFAYLEAGSGPLALCLHGFPDSAWSWRHLLSELAAAGFHAVAPFMRGYAPTQVPDDAHYYPAALGADACALHAAFGGAEVAPEHGRYAAALGQPTPKPTLYLHGSADNALGVELVNDVEQFLAPGSEVVVLDGLNHFLQLERPDEVNRRIVEFVAK